MPINEFLLSGGTRFLAEPIATTKAVAIGFWFFCGSRDESADANGITHFVEHMLFKGTSSHSARDISRFFDKTGGYCNAFTEREALCVHCLVPSRYALEAMRILRDMTSDSLFLTSDIEAERKVILNEIVSSLDEPEEQAADRFFASLFPGSTYSLPVAGTVESVSSLSETDLVSFWNSLVKNGPALVSVAGNFDVQQCKELLETFGFNPSPLQISFQPELKRGFFDFHAGYSGSYSPFSQTQIWIASLFPMEKTSESWYAGELLACIVGDTPGSRLFQELREKEGLCYNVFTSFLPTREGLYLISGCSVNHDAAEKTMGVLLSEFDKLRMSGINRAEFDYAREHLTGDLLLSAEDTDTRMKRLARQYLYNKSVFGIDQSAGIIESLDFDCVHNISKKAFAPESMHIFTYGTKKAVRKCVKLLKC
ncbi:MAG: insulinase family protein [Spirochaetales bacterium]|nr:insulinase family protein [Spirochaetales bacterium]